MSEVISIITKDLKQKVVEEHKLVYDSPTEGLEQVYFWLLDFTSAQAEVEKLVDNFESTPGSGHFSELIGKKTSMQNEISKILGNVNIVIKSILNIIYDLKEFQIRLAEYDAANSKDKDKAESGLLTLKQIWMDQVDIKKGAGSINALTQQLNFITLRDAFMAVDSVGKIEKMDLNDRVKRILKARLTEFFEWKERSEKELKKRFEIEKIYLKSQVAALKLYSRWLRPYLKAAAQLEMSGSDKLKLSRNPSLVTAFSSIVLEVTLLVKKKINFEEEIIDRNLPEGFKSKGISRDYYSCVLIDFFHRGIPQRVSQQGHYSFGGRTEVSFKAFALNKDELELLYKKIDEQYINDAFRISADVAEESLAQLKDDLDYYLNDKEEKKEKEKKKEETNPFSALFSIFKWKRDKENTKKDSYVESIVRQLALRRAAEMSFNIFDTYKKSHGMPSPPAKFFAG